MIEEDLDRYWKTVVGTIKDGIMIVDTAGSIVSVNEAFEVMTGYARDEVVGQKCAILNCSLFNFARSKGGSHWCVLLDSGSLDMRRCTIMRKNGTVMPILKTAAALYDSKGRIIGAVETLADITEIVEKDKQIAAFRRQLRSEDSFQDIIGTSAAMQQVFGLIENAARSDAPVLILGESGTGKGLVARAIHRIGSRGKKPFVCVNCAALAESLLESELFGHVKGAYTGAYKGRAGRFEMAQGGDIFLDEIGDLSLSTQVKLLRVLEEKVVERVGGNEAIPVDVRIISATNRNLPGLLEKGTFRRDFYFRINVIPIKLPPLRERVEDIPLLAEFFFQKLNLKTGREIQRIANATMEILRNHPWPGNVREMKSAFEYAFVTCNEPVLQPQHLPPDMLGEKKVAGDQKPSPTATSRQARRKKELIEALEQAKGNKSMAAEILGISRVTVWNRMKRFGITCTRHLEPVEENDDEFAA